MKKIYLFLTMLCLVAAYFLVSCKKSNNNPDPLSQLPAATQTGANTVGCLVNGQVLLPSTAFLSGSSGYQSNYIYTKGDYFFTLAFDDESDNTNIRQIVIGTDSLAITQGQYYSLKSFVPKGASANYFHTYGLATTDEYKTNSVVTGQLYISHFDQTNQIVSGTFYFNAIRTIGDTVHITDGRFDMHYTR